MLQELGINKSAEKDKPIRRSVGGATAAGAVGLGLGIAAPVPFMKKTTDTLQNVDNYVRIGKYTMPALAVPAAAAGGYYAYKANKDTTAGKVLSVTGGATMGAALGGGVGSIATLGMDLANVGKKPGKILSKAMKYTTPAVAAIGAGIGGYKAASLRVNDVEDHMQMYIKDKWEPYTRRLIEEQNQKRFALRHPVLTGIPTLGFAPRIAKEKAKDEIARKLYRRSTEYSQAARNLERAVYRHQINKLRSQNVSQ